MLPGHPRTPSQIIGELLTGHPEAASLHAEASHRRALARSSAAIVRQAFAVAQAARLRYEELRHRLDPRRLRTVDFGAGLLVLVSLGAGLTLLDVIELSGLLGTDRSVLPALAAAVVWLIGAWLAAVASRERRWPLVIAAVAAAVLLGLLLVLARLWSGPRPASPRASCSGSLSACSSSCSWSARRCSWPGWSARRCSGPVALAPGPGRSRGRGPDRAGRHQAATVARPKPGSAWSGPGRARSPTTRHLVHETVALAVALLESGRPQLPRPEP